MTAYSKSLSFRTLSGCEFETALGMCRPTGEQPLRIDATSLQDLKYFQHRSVLHRSTDTRVMFVALGQGEAGAENPTRPVVGLLELQSSPYDPAEAWLMYVSVAAPWRLQGISRRLVAMMAMHLLKTRQRLRRSMASDEGAATVQRTIDSTLDALGIRWTQSGRDTQVAGLSS